MGMDTVTAAAAKRLETMNGANGSGLARERAMIAWIAFDPKDRTKSRIQIKTNRPILDIRDALDEILEED